MKRGITKVSVLILMRSTSLTYRDGETLYAKNYKDVILGSETPLNLNYRMRESSEDLISKFHILPIGISY